MSQPLSPELPLTRGESSSSEILNTSSGSKEIVKWGPSKENAMSAPTPNNHPTTTQKKQPKKQLDSVNEYTVGIITVLAHEKTAVISMLDEQHDPPVGYSQAKHDDNSYSWGMMRGHNVAVASLGAGSYGTTDTAHTVAPMLSSLPEMRFGLLVGIGAGIPQKDLDIRLGDVAISIPGSGSGGVYQYDAFKAKLDGLEHIGFLNKPSAIPLKGVQTLRSKHLMEDSDVPEYLRMMVQTWPKMARSTPANPSFMHQDCSKDRLFPADYHHVPGEKNCDKCDPGMAIRREDRDTMDPEFHYGIIASGDTLVKNSIHRDELVQRIPGCICFEMEAAGVMNKLPCLIIRGICDYGDSHKNDVWQNYAAAVAAGYAKELLSVIAPVEVANSKPASAAAVQDIKKTVDEIQSIATKAQVDSRMKNLRKWIAPPDTSAAYRNARYRHQPGTCDWFLTSETFRRWEEGDISLIWIHGIPGCGKTILSSSIIHELKWRAQNGAEAVLYFYFEHTATGNISFDGMVQSFAAHLFSENDKAQEALQHLHDDNPNEPPAVEDLVKLFPIMANHFNRVQIVIDALDEIKCRNDLLRVLAWIKAMESERRIQLIVTSRTEEDIERRLEGLGETVLLTNDLVKDDIKKYVEKQIREDEDFQKWDENTEAQNTIKSTLIDDSDGMFRLVVCQLDELRNCRNYKDLTDALAILPRTLKEVYQRILERMDSRTQRQRAITILQLLLYWDTVSTEMALDAIIVDPSHRSAKFDPINRFPQPRELATICGALVTIDWYEQGSWQKKPSGILRIAHFSVREYLTSSDQVHEDFKDAFQESTARACFTQIGLGYLSHVPTPLAYDMTVNQYPLTSFAMNWPIYAYDVQQDRRVAQAIRAFFENDAYHSFVRLYNHWDDTKAEDCIGNEEVSDHLWILSSLGLEDCLEMALNECSPSELLNNNWPRLDLGKLRPKFQEFDPLVRICGGWEKTPRKQKPREQRETGLYFAARNGWSSIVDTLLTRNVDVHVEGGERGTALNVAMYSGESDVVNILQRHYDNLHPQMFTPAILNTLKCATETYYEPPVGFDIWLQEALKRITPCESDFIEVLRAALLYGDQKLVDLSLNYAQSDALLNVIGTTFVDAIRAGQESRAERILRIVDNSPQYPPIEGDANTAKDPLINAVDEQYGRSALHLAAERGHAGLTKALIARHANINFRDKFDETPLHRAAEHGRTEVAEILIAQGADIKAIDKCFRVPLRSAFLNDHLDTCWTVSPSRLGNQSFPSFLNEIDRGNKCEDTPQAPQSTERVVDQRWRKTGVQQRIESKFPEAQSFLHSTSNLYEFRRRVEFELESLEENLLFHLVRQLRNAILSGEHEHVRAALHGSHVPEVVNARLFEDGMSTPLLLAASKGFHEIFRILLDESANPNLMDLSGRSAMQILDPKKYGPKVNIPIFASFAKRGWCLDDPYKQGQTYLDVIKRQKSSSDGTTCLHYAAREGCTEIVNALLDSGAEIDTQNKDGKTPVDYARAADQLDVFGIRLDGLIRPSETKNMPNASEGRLHEDRFTEPSKHEPSTIKFALKLHRAVRHNEIDTVSALLGTSDVDLAFINLVDSAGRSVIHLAVHTGNHRLVQSLLEGAAMANASDCERNKSSANYLVNVKDDDRKRTPLHYAAEAGHLSIVKTLVKEGALLWVLDDQGKTPRDLANIRFRREVADWLKSEEDKKGV